MKLSDGFDARRLRPRRSGGWCLRLLSLLAILLAGLGLALCLGGIALWLGHPTALAALPGSSPGALLLLGGVALFSGVLAWRLCRRRGRAPSELSMAPHLLKKRD
jgi:membrane protein implicated in regulation of membrane protease activity